MIHQKAKAGARGSRATGLGSPNPANPCEELALADLTIGRRRRQADRLARRFAVPSATAETLARLAYGEGVA